MPSVRTQDYTGTGNKSKLAIFVPHWNYRRFCDAQLPARTNVMKSEKMNKYKSALNIGSLRG
jgi:hypothetical protein